MDDGEKVSIATGDIELPGVTSGDAKDVEVRSNVGSDVKEVVAMDDEEELDMTTSDIEL